MQPHRSKYWKIPPDSNAAFVANMEDVLAVYALPFDARRPVVCMDESDKQLVGEVHAPLAAGAGHPRLVDHEYVRNGVAEIFVDIEPLAGRRHIEVTEQRTRQDWARFIRGLLEERYPNADQVVLVMDNLNTHAVTSLYETFPPAQARRLAERLDIHYTPKHGSWLNIAEIELSALNSQCLDRESLISNPCSAKSPPGRSREITAELPSIGASPPRILASNSLACIRNYE